MSDSKAPQFRFSAQDFEGLQFGAQDLLAEMFARRANDLLEAHLDSLDETTYDGNCPKGYDDVYALWPLRREKWSRDG